MDDEVEIETPAQRRARRRRETARRSREYRGRQKLERIPSARAVDNALSEAMAFELACTATMVNQRPGDAVVSVVAVLQTAKEILKREGYDGAKSAKAVFNRVQPRPEHTEPFFTPSLKPDGRAELNLPPRRYPGGPRPFMRPSADPIADMLLE